MGKSTYTMGFVASVDQRTIGGEGQIFAILLRTY